MMGPTASNSPRFLRAAPLLSAIFGLSLIGCGPGVADFSQDLGDGYSFVSAGPLQKYILLGGEYAVRNVVADFDYDEMAIIAVRLVVEEYECDPGPTLTEVVTENVEFWVIDKSERVSVGPMSLEEFQSRRQALGVVPGLRLDHSKVHEILERAKRFNRRERVESGECRPFTPK